MNESEWNEWTSNSSLIEPLNDDVKITSDDDAAGERRGFSSFSSNEWGKLMPIHQHMLVCVCVFVCPCVSIFCTAGRHLIDYTFQINALIPMETGVCVLYCTSDFSPVLLRLPARIENSIAVAAVAAAAHISLSLGRDRGKQVSERERAKEEQKKEKKRNQQTNTHRQF